MVGFAVRHIFASGHINFCGGGNITETFKSVDLDFIVSVIKELGHHIL